MQDTTAQLCLRAQVIEVNHGHDGQVQVIGEPVAHMVDDDLLSFEIYLPLSYTIMSYKCHTNVIQMGMIVTLRYYYYLSLRSQVMGVKKNGGY